MSRLRRPLMIVLTALALGYAAIVLVAFLSQRALLFPAPPPNSPLVTGDLRAIAVPGKPEVFFVHAPPPDANVGRTLVYFHGNGEQLASSLWLAKAARSAGLGFLAIEYPGYGDAAAQEKGEAAFYAAAERALHAAVTAHGHSRERLALLGFSLGGGVATEMAHRGWGSRLILVAPFTSTVDVASRAFPFLPARWLLRDRFDNLAKAPHIQIPVLVLHGERDSVIPVELGQQLARAFPAAHFVPLPRADHADALIDALDRVIDFAAER